MYYVSVSRTFQCILSIIFQGHLVAVEVSYLKAISACADSAFLSHIGPRYTWATIFWSGCPLVYTRGFADLTDVTLADEDTTLF